MITGHECYGCGITKAITALLQLDFNAALNYNKFVIIVFPILLFVWIKYIYNTLKNT